MGNGGGTRPRSGYFELTWIPKCGDERRLSLPVSAAGNSDRRLGSTRSDQTYDVFRVTNDCVFRLEPERKLNETGFPGPSVPERVLPPCER